MTTQPQTLRVGQQEASWGDPGVTRVRLPARTGGRDAGKDLDRRHGEGEQG